MSEYQYYEFRAVDRPLTAKEQATLRTCSSHAEITSNGFSVDYAWGDFKGDADEWMEKYFDAFIHLANWGTHELKLRLPQKVLPLATVKPYCVGDFVSARAKGDRLVLSFRSEDEEGGGWIDEEECRESLAALLPVREELADGDLRALYLGWLGCARAGELDDGDTEPPCPPGLGELSPALEALASFLRIDEDLLGAAAAASPALRVTDDGAFEAWLAALPEAEKTSLLIRLVAANEAHLRAELLGRFRESRAAGRLPAEATVAPRSVGELLEAARSRAEERERRAAAREARGQARLERKAAEARERQLAALAPREAEAWQQVDALIASMKPKSYDEAVALLRDLRDLCVRDGRQDEAARRIARLREEHSRKSSFIERLRGAALS